MPTAKRSSPTSIKAFEKYGVLNERELHARYEVALEQYNKTVNIEAQLMVLMANRYILPAAYRYQEQLARPWRRSRPPARPRRRRKRGARRDLQADRRVQAAASMRCTELLEHEGNGDAEKHAKYFRDKVIPAMNALREVGDALETHRAAETCGRCRPTGRCFS